MPWVCGVMLFMAKGLPATSCSAAPFQFTVKPLAPMAPSSALSLACTTYLNTSHWLPKAAERVAS